MCGSEATLHAGLDIKDVVVAIHMPALPLPKCGRSRTEERSFFEYALHGARENDPDARVCDHACGRGGFSDLRTGLRPILGRFLLRRLGWLGLGRSLVRRLGQPLSLGSLLSTIAQP